MSQGCFWGPENYFNKKFKGAILKSAVGYTGGSAPSPKYNQVCSGATGHAEAIKLDFDPAKVTYPDLVNAQLTSTVGSLGAVNLLRQVSKWFLCLLVYQLIEHRPCHGTAVLALSDSQVWYGSVCCACQSGGVLLQDT